MHALHQDDSHDDEPAGGHGDQNEGSDFDAFSDDSRNHSDDTGSEDGSGGGTGPNGQKQTWRLREILFYDDKISIFKARHGRL